MHSMTKWRQDNPDKALRLDLVPYGVTLEWYRAKEVEQGGLCAVCRQPETIRRRDGTIRRFVVDHDHIFGNACALVCQRCNTMLGWLEQAELRAMGEAYLRSHARYTVAAVVAVKVTPLPPPCTFYGTHRIRKAGRGVGTCSCGYRPPNSRSRWNAQQTANQRAHRAAKRAKPAVDLILDDGTVF